MHTSIEKKSFIEIDRVLALSEHLSLDQVKERSAVCKWRAALGTKSTKSAHVCRSSFESVRFAWSSLVAQSGSREWWSGLSWCGCRCMSRQVLYDQLHCCVLLTHALPFPFCSLPLALWLRCLFLSPLLRESASEETRSHHRVADDGTDTPTTSESKSDHHLTLYCSVAHIPHSTCWSSVKVIIEQSVNYEKSSFNKNSHH